MATYKVTTSWNFSHTSEGEILVELPTVEKAIAFLNAVALETGKSARLGVVMPDGKMLELGSMNPSQTDWRSAGADMILLVRSIAAELKSLSGQ